MDDFINELTGYTVKRTSDESCVPLYYTENFRDEMTYQEFIALIAAGWVDFMDLDEKGELPSHIHSESQFIADRTGFDESQVEVVLWYIKCQRMENDGIIWVEACPNCGYKELFEREVLHAGIYESYLQCPDCGAEHDFEDLFIDIPTLDLNEKLPISTYQCSPLDGLNPKGLPVFTDENAVFRFRVSRKVFELPGSDTLADFCYSIRGEFNLDSERASSFFMNNKMYDSNHEISCPRVIPFEPDYEFKAEDYRICDLNLFDQQQFIYLHDFRRDNRFNIRFIGVR